MKPIKSSEDIKNYQKRKVKVMKNMAKLGVSYKIALKTIGEDEMWMSKQIVTVSNGMAIKLADYYAVYYAEAIVENLQGMKAVGSQSSFKELLSFGFEKELELKEKDNRSKKRESKKSISKEERMKNLLK